MEQFRPGVALFILNDDNEILILQRKSEKPDNGKWCLPGGGLERGEDIYDAFVRETKEETGIDLAEEISQIVKYDVDTCYYPAPYDSYHLTIYGVYRLGDYSLLDTLENMEPEKCYQMQWVTLEDFCNYSEDQIAFYDVLGVAKNLWQTIKAIDGIDNLEDCGCDCDYCDETRSEIGYCPCDGDCCDYDDNYPCSCGACSDNEDDDDDETSETYLVTADQIYTININGVDSELNLCVDSDSYKIVTVNVEGEGHSINLHLG